MSVIKKTFEANLYDTEKPEKEGKVTAVAPPAYADAQANRVTTRAEILKRFKDQTANTKEFIADNHNRGKKVKVKGLAKLQLDERLFEDYFAVPKPTKHVTLKEAKEETDLWTLVYNELCGDIRAQDAPERRFKVGKNTRYQDSNMSFDDATISIHSDDVKDFEFAKKVANEYGVKYEILKAKNRYAPKKYEIKIHTDQMV